MKGINDMDKKSIADLVVYGKIFTSGMLWHNMPTGVSEILKTMIP